MAISSSFDELRDLTVFIAEGELTFEEQIAVLRDFYGGTTTANVIWDFRLLGGTRISSEELEKIIAFSKSHESRRPKGKTALVAATNLDFGLSRMSQAYADNKKMLWEIRAFRSMDEAVKWIDGK